MVIRILRFSLVLLLSSASWSAQAKPEVSAAGFVRESLADGTEIGIWYPAKGEAQRQRLGLYEQDVVTNGELVGGRHPLIVMSHGSGGGFGGHYDTAVALARSGFVVAALTHPGDNFKDQSRQTDVAARPVALRALIDHMIGGWRHRAIVDPARIGAFGFSAGGFTVLAAAGGRPDLSRIAAHCAAHPDFYDCRLIRSQPPRGAAWPDVTDPRIKALVVAAPALGFTFDRAALAGVKVPVQLWKAGSDAILPAPFYADAVRDSLSGKPEFHAVTGAGHFDFLAPCAVEAAASPICTSAAGFDRTAFHKEFNDDVVRFFRQHLQGR
jgi:predicted dienelactone hydrolase